MLSDSRVENDMRCINRIDTILMLKTIFFLLLIILCFISIFKLKKTEPSPDRYRPLQYFENHKPSECEIEDWNKVNTHSIPNADLFKKWAVEGVSRQDDLYYAQSRILSAYVYRDHISIVTASPNKFRKTVYCRYFDCNRNELPKSAWKSYIFPFAVAFCVRRAGAEYVSLTYSEFEEPQDPVPLTYRAMKKPVHELAVCVGPIFGNESKWLEIVEFVEHYRLLGASYFYFTLYNLDDYDRRVIDDYVRLGLVEVHFYQSEYEKLGWQFHPLQQTECQQRSKHHSKWVINVDIDERLSLGSHISFIKYLRSIPENVGEITFSIHRVAKFEELPEKYINETQLLAEMNFLKYNQTTQLTWGAFKSASRPDKVVGYFYHWTLSHLPGVRVFNVPKSIALVKHYRSTEAKALGGGWAKNYTGFKATRLEVSFENRLKIAVMKRVKYVYKQRLIRCEELPPERFSTFRRDLLDCEFKHEVEERERMKNHQHNNSTV